MKREVRIKLRILTIGLCAVVALLAVRLYFVQIVHGSDYSLRADRQYISSSQDLYDRGSIYFTRKDGTYISAATLATGFILSINPSQITDASTTYEKLNTLIPVDREAFTTSVQKKNDPYEIIGRHVSEEVGRAVEAAKIKGVTVTRERWRIYPAELHAAQSIGFIGYNNDNVVGGHYGLERYYNDVLDRKAVGLFGNFFAELFANLGDVVVDANVHGKATS